ncbi:MAG: sulfurtransferase complex subunit TusB [Thermoprotei archaeon]|nr:MAG: sulfurtransferase complex subunit TusB [Thermoprotei archaeon]
MTSILYVIYKSPLINQPSSSVLEIAEQQLSEGVEVGVLLVADAVVAAVSRTVSSTLRRLREKGASIYVLREDLEARGLSQEVADLVGYSEAIDLIERYEKVFTWS